MSAGARSREESLVGIQWVEDHLADPSLVLLEVDERPALYELGHVPGARRLDWASDLQDPVRRGIPDAEAMSGLWERAGVREDSTVVFYGDLNNWLAAFGYWLFSAYGLRSVRLLDGGRQAWVTSGRALSRESPPARRDGLVPEPRFRPELRADRDYVARAAREGQLVDVRTPEEYVGDWLSEPEFPGESAQRPGHIPGAVNVPWDEVLQLDGTLRSDAELTGLYAAAGLSPQAETVSYCRIGERSAHTWFVLHEILGWPTVRNYDGSWTEWGSMVGMPVALGPAPGRFPDGPAD